MKSSFGSDFNHNKDWDDLYYLYKLTEPDDLDYLDNDSDEDDISDNLDYSDVDDSDENHNVSKNVDSNNTDFFTAYKNMREALDKLAEVSKTREKLDYMKLVTAMIFYSINKFVFNGCLSTEESKTEFLYLINEAQIECIDASVESFYYVMVRKESWYTFSENMCKYGVDDMGSFWQAVLLMPKFCRTDELLFHFLASYVNFINAIASYLSKKYSNKQFISQAGEYINELIDNLAIYMKIN